MPVLLLVLGLVMLFTGAFFGYLLRLSANPKNLAETTGELLRTQKLRHIPGRSGHKHVIIQKLTKYTYQYTVQGKTYRVRGELWNHKHRLRPSGRIIYLRGFPWAAYLDQFTGQRKTLFFLLPTIWGVLFLVLYILIVLC